MPTQFDQNLKPLDLLKTIELRRSSVYASPGEQTFLQIPLGDFSDTGVPAVLIDGATNLYHVSDVPIPEITRVDLLDTATGSIDEAVTGTTASFKFYPSYLDNTGRRIAAVQSLNDVSNKTLRVYCKGVGVSNPVEILRWVADYTGASPDTLNQVRLEESRFEYEGKFDLRYLLNDEITLKKFLDELVRDCCSALVSTGYQTWIQPVVRENLF